MPGGRNYAEVCSHKESNYEPEEEDSSEHSDHEDESNYEHSEEKNSSEHSDNEDDDDDDDDDYVTLFRSFLSRDTPTRSKILKCMTYDI